MLDACFHQLLKSNAGAVNLLQSNPLPAEQEPQMR
jgi:hypothetical protein